MLNKLLKKADLGKNSDVNVLVSNTVFMYILQISGFIFPLITFPYLTRVLGVEKYGILIFTSAIMIYFQQVIDFGFILSGTRKCSLLRNDKDKLSETILNIVYSKILLSFVSFGILILIIIFVEKFSFNRTFLLLSFIPIFLGAFNTDFLFRGLEKMKIVTIRVLIVKFVYTIAIIIFVNSPSDLLLVPIITAVGELIAIVWVWRYIYFNLKLKPLRKKIGKNILLELRESLPYFISRISTTAYNSLNTIVLGFKYSNLEMGIYGASYSLSSKTRSLISPLASSVYPYTVRTKNFKLIKVMLLILVPLSLIFLSIGYIYAKQIIVFVAGSDYESSYKILRIFLIGLSFALPQYLLAYPVLGALGLVKETNYAVFIGAIYHIIGITILSVLGSLEFISIAYLTVSTEFLILSIRVYYLSKYYKLKKME